MESTTLSPGYPYREPWSICSTFDHYDASKCDQLLYTHCPPPGLFSASSHSSSPSSTDITDLSDLFQSQSPPGDIHYTSSIPSELTTYQQKPSPPSKNGKSTRSKRHHSTASKPYRRTTSPVFPDGSIPISSVTNIKSNLQCKLTTPSDHKTENIFQCSPKAPVLANLQHHYAKQFEDIDKKLLKLYSEKAKLLRLAKDNSTVLQKSSVKEVPLSILPTGRLEFDLDFNEEANLLLLAIGGLYTSYESAVDKIISLCSSANSSISNITECFPYIQSLSINCKLFLQETSSLKLVKLEHPPNAEVSQGLTVILDAINAVLERSQMIQRKNSSITSMLSTYQEKVQFNINCLDRLFVDSTIDVRNHIHTILTTNYTVLTMAKELWQKYYQLALTTITNISESLAAISNSS